MANVLTGNVWVIDTPGAGLLFTGWIKVAQVYWNNPTAAATFVIQDVETRTLLAATFASTGQQPVWAYDNTWWHGLRVTTLSSGTLEITVE